jgi:2Fe-2S ferredoxin
LAQSKYENCFAMAKINIQNLFGKILPVEDTQKTLLRHFHDHHLDWMQACGGKGRCTTCKVVVIDGAHHISALTPAELIYRRQKALKENERLSCQVKILDDIVILAPEEYKLPHVKYSD